MPGMHTPAGPVPASRNAPEPAPPCATFLIDSRHRLATWNAGVQRVLGWDKDAWLARSFESLCAQNEGADDLVRLLRDAGNPGTVERDIALIRQDGSIVRVSMSLTCVEAADAGCNGVVAVCRPEPIGAAEAAADALAASFGDGRSDDMLAGAFAAALEAVPDGVYVGTSDGIVHCNGPALDMLGASSVQDLRNRIDELGARFRVRRERAGPPLPPSELPFVRALNGEPAVLETWATRPDGSDVFMRGTSAPIFVGGKVVGAIAINSDTTERLEMEEAMQAAREEAERANRVKDEFLAVVSHELRAPLSAILGWSTLLLRSAEQLPSQVQKGLAAIDRNARLQGQLVDDLLDVSRIESGQLRLEMQPVDLTEVVASAVDTLHPAASERNQRIDVEIDVVPALVLGDADRLQQVVSNLLANAIKFTPDGGSVHMQLQGDDAWLRVIVADTGQGIDPAFLPHVFDRFRQEDGARTRRPGGLGLGLSIVRDLVRLHGGDATAESLGRGHGARFTVALPRHVKDRNIA